MSILKDAIEVIQQTAVAATEARIIDVPGDGRKKMIQVGNSVTEWKATPACRRHTVNSLADLIAYAGVVVESLPADDAPRDNCGTPVLWHGASGVVLVIDDQDRRDTVRFPLTFSARFQRLRKLEEERRAYDQRQFVRLLRIELGLPNDGVVAKFRKLDWKTSDEGSGSVQHGRDRMGKSISAEVQGIDELPEEISVPAPVYAECGERQEYLVRCAIEIDTINQTLSLTPLPEEIEKAVDNAHHDIHQRLSAEFEDKVPVYYGTP